MKDQDEQSWHPDGADVPRWVPAAAVAALVMLLVLVVLAVRA